MAKKSELSLDSETSKAMEAMRNETPIETPTPETKAEETATKVESVQTVEEPAEEDTSSQEDATPSKKTVPLAALHESREALKEAKREKEEMQKRFDDRFSKIAEALARQNQPEQQPVAQVQIPDPDKDALGTLRYTAQQIKELQDYKQRQEIQQQQQEQRRELQMRAADLESQFMRETPDYNDAGMFLSNSRRNELMATGMYNPMQVQKILQEETFALAQQAIQAGNNPAKIVYEIAKARGYSKKEAIAAVVQETDADRLAKINAGQAASKSIGQAQGAQTSSGKTMDAKTLANMSDTDFEKFYSKLNRSERAALMGS